MKSFPICKSDKRASEKEKRVNECQIQSDSKLRGVTVIGIEIADSFRHSDRYQCKVCAVVIW